MTKEEYDVFFSYVHKDKDSAIRIVEALRASGIKVWFDENEIKDYDGIIRHLTKGLSHSKALVAYYSAKYPKSRFCQWEFTSAFLASQREGDPTKRIMVLNPEKGHEHIMPSEFQGALFKRVPENVDDAALNVIVESIKERVSRIANPIGHISTFDKPTWYGRNGIFYPNFVGRLSDMWNIHTKLNSYETILITSGTAQVQGMGGIGKSLLVEEYAMRFGAAYPGGIYWLSASQADPKNPDSELERQLRNIALELGIPRHAFETDREEERLPLIIGAIGHHLKSYEAPSLWIVDDIPVGMNSENLRRWFAPHHNGKTLITTRSTEYNVAERIPLDVLEKEDAYTLITSRKKPKNELEEKAAWEIIEMLGFHALAVDVASSALQFQSYSEFLEGLKNPKEDELELAAKLTGQLPNGHEPSIAITLLRSIKLLSDEGKDFLRLASILAEAPIPSKLVQKVFEFSNGIDESEARKMGLLALHQVNSHSLATPVEGEEAWEVHTLISRTMRFHEQTENTIKTFPTKLYSTIIEALNYLLSENVLEIQRHGQIKFEIIHVRKLTNNINTMNSALLADLLGKYDFNRGSYNSAETLQKKALKVLKKDRGEKDRDTLGVMNNLALSLDAQGKYNEAETIQEKILIVTKQVFGHEHPNTLSLLENTALTKYRKGDYHAAKNILTKFLSTKERILGKEHLDTLTTMNNLANILRELGNPNEAKVMLENALKILFQIKGEENPQTLTTMNSLAITYRQIGDLTNAKTIYEKSLTIRRRILGEKHPETLSSVNNLAELLIEMNELDAATKMLQTTIEISKELLGEEHPDTLTAVSNLAVAIGTQGDLNKAISSYRDLLNICTRIHGKEHPETIRCMSNLAFYLGQDGKLAEAIKLCEKVFEIRKRQMGTKNYSTTEAAWNLFCALNEKKEHHGAKRILREELLWLLKADVNILHPKQKYYREQIAKITGAKN